MGLLGLLSTTPLDLTRVSPTPTTTKSAVTITNRWPYYSCKPKNGPTWLSCYVSHSFPNGLVIDNGLACWSTWLSTKRSYPFTDQLSTYSEQGLLAQLIEYVLVSQSKSPSSGPPLNVVACFFFHD